MPESIFQELQSYTYTIQDNLRFCTSGSYEKESSCVDAFTALNEEKVMTQVIDFIKSLQSISSCFLDSPPRSGAPVAARAGAVVVVSFVFSQLTLIVLTLFALFALFALLLFVFQELTLVGGLGPAAQLHGVRGRGRRGRGQQIRRGRRG